MLYWFLKACQQPGQGSICSKNLTALPHKGNRFLRGLNCSKVAQCRFTLRLSEQSRAMPALTLR